MTSFNITPAGFKQFSSFLEKSCGIVLTENKQYLVHCRLAKIMNQHAFSDLESLMQAMSRSSARDLNRLVIDAMTTNETLWFRDLHPYEVLKNKFLPEYISSSSSRVKIWSAACSTGQEPYSMAMVATEYIEANASCKGAKVDVIATDISSEALELAKKGEYEAFALGRGLSDGRKAKFFTQSQNNSWVVSPQIKSSITFRAINLLDSYSMIDKVDIIFCRNVLIYFSAEIKQKIIEKMHAQLKPGGYLVLGASESMPRLINKFEMVHCRPGIVYKAI
jgi:chemotaxis protein methyltransferase CheR